MYGLTRASTTLLAAAVGGLLIWFATQINDTHVGGFWAVYGLIAGAGLLMALSQLLGGWRKWGMPRLSSSFFLLAFVPITIVSLWIVFAAEPGHQFFHRHVLSWSGDLHIRGVVNDLKEYVPLFALGIGLAFGYSFDTAGPRRAPAARPATTTRLGRLGRRGAVPADNGDRAVEDEPVTRERVASDGEIPLSERERVRTR
jgi:hypothetical protein